MNGTLQREPIALETPESDQSQGYGRSMVPAKDGDSMKIDENCRRENADSNFGS